MQESNSDSNHKSSSGKEHESKPRKKSTALKIAGLLSTVLWIVGFILPFVIPPTSKYVWLSDTLLLIGFWPLLFIHPAGWTWAVFGILNMVIGFFLEFNKQIPPFLEQSNFWSNPERLALKPQFMTVQKHIADMHPCMPWLLIGFVSTVYGAFRIVKTIVRWIIKLVKKTKQ